MADKTTLYSEFKVTVSQSLTLNEMKESVQTFDLDANVEGITEYDPEEAHRPSFEEWVRSNRGWLTLERKSEGDYTSYRARDLWQAWLASRREFE